MSNNSGIKVNEDVKESKISTYQITVMGLMTALLCILAPMSIPLPGGIPFSFTNLVLFLTVYLLGGKKGTICYSVYLLIGAIGLPVFSGFSGGFGKIAGPTGGFLIGFIFTAMICGLFLKLGKGNIWMYVIGMVLGMFVLYSFGTGWFMYVSNMNLLNTLTVCVLPFLIGDGIKIILIAMIGPMLRSRLIKAGVLQ